jgi:nucleoside-diphosphate-sugar epimerase
VARDFHTISRVLDGYLKFLINSTRYKLPRQKVLVIGASGFIGGNIVEALCETGGIDVYAGVRSEKAPDYLNRPQINIVHCDLSDSASINNAFAGMDVVVNCARGRVQDIRHETLNMLERAVAARVGKVIQFSSVAVYGNAKGLITEDTKPGRGAGRYGKEKLAAEELCRDASSQGVHIAILRPALVYGPRGEEWFLRYARGSQSGRLRRLGPRGDGDANLIYVSDLAAFVIRLVNSKIPQFSVFNMNGPEIGSFNDYFDLINQELAFKASDRSNNLPGKYSARGVLRRAARRAVAASSLILKKLSITGWGIGKVLAAAEHHFRSEVGDEPYGEYSGRKIYSNVKAVSFGFEPVTSIKDGLVFSIKWARGCGVLD